MTGASAGGGDGQVHGARRALVYCPGSLRRHGDDALCVSPVAPRRQATGRGMLPVTEVEERAVSGGGHGQVHRARRALGTEALIVSNSTIARSLPLRRYSKCTVGTVQLEWARATISALGDEDLSSELSSGRGRGRSPAVAERRAKRRWRCGSFSRLKVSSDRRGPGLVRASQRPPATWRGLAVGAARGAGRWARRSGRSRARGRARGLGRA